LGNSPRIGRCWRFIGLIIAFWAFLSGGYGRAADGISELPEVGRGEGPWEISADRLTYDRSEQVYVARGGVVISKGENYLYADEAVYDLQAHTARVKGNVRLETAGDVLTGDRGVFNLETRTGRISHGCLFLSENHFYVRAEVMEKVGDKSYLLRQCEVTTCDGEKPAWKIEASEVRVTLEGYGTIKHATFRAAGIPMAYFPYAVFPAKTRRQTGLLTPRVGYSTRNGVDVELPFFWSLSEQTDATLYQRYMSERGYMQGMEYRYVAEKESKGVFLFDILEDRKKKDLTQAEDVEISPYSRTNQSRYWFRGRVDQDLPFSTSARLDLDFLSDQDYLREFDSELFGLEVRPDLEDRFKRPFGERRSPTRRSILRLSRSFEDWSLQAGGAYYQRQEDPPENPEEETSQPVSGLSLGLLPIRLPGAPLYLSLDSDYDYIWREEGIEGHSTSISPKITAPLWLGRYVEVEPSIDYTLNFLDHENASRDRDQTQTAYRAGLRTAANLQRVYEANWGNVRRLKHRIWPVLRYSYGEAPDEGTSPWFEPIDQMERENRVSFSLENFLDARLEDQEGNVSYRQWATLDLTQGYDIGEAREEGDPAEEAEPFDPLEVSVLLRPLPSLDLRGDILWDHYDSCISRARMSLDLSVDRAGGRTDFYELDYSYVRGGGRSLKLQLDVGVWGGVSLGGSLERDLEIDRDVSRRYWVKYSRQCWGVKLGAEEDDEETTLMVIFELKGLGEIAAL